jgi:hypothetical protein
MPAPEPGGQIPTRTQSQGSTGSHQDPGTNTNTLSLGSTPKGGGGFLHVGSFDLGYQAVEVSGNRDVAQDLESRQ